MRIRPFEQGDEEAVVALWERCGLLRPWNDPRKDIRRKLAVQRELFLVGEVDAAVVAVAMAGYDGHRGWVNYFAVDPDHRHEGLGRQLMDDVEQRLRRLGCPKINVQIRGDNEAAIGFYASIGFAEDDCVSMGKRLEVDGPGGPQRRVDRRGR